MLPMNMSGTPTPTARRNLAWRVEQLLRAQEAMPVPTLTNWQADTVTEAITALDEEWFADGQNAMMKAERPDLWQTNGSSPATRVEVEQLLGLLKEALAE